MEPADEVVARRIGTKVGNRWTLQSLLGTGGMAAVYAARDDAGNQAAIKILHPEMSLRRDVRERFLREAYVANKVGHPGAVGVVEHFDGGEEQTFLVMELLAGEPLSERVRRQGVLPLPELLDYLDQMLDVLSAAHEQGIVHRDLKPDNLFVTDDGRIKILDFGVARLLHDAPGDYKTRTGMALGTLPYMAPEQALGKRDEIDGRADLFSVGATAFRILAGRKVHEANSDAELLIAMASKPVLPLATLAPSVPADVCAVVDMALAFSKEARYPDARTMQNDVRAVRRGERPPFASSRLSAREQSTRMDMPAVPAAAAMQAVRTPTVVAPGAPAQPAARTPTVVAPAAAAARTPTVVAPPASVGAPPSIANTSPAVYAPTVEMPAPPVSQPAPQSMGAFVATHVPESVQSEPERAPRKSSRSLLIVLGVLAVALVGGAAIFAFADDSTDAESEPAETAAPEGAEPSDEDTSRSRAPSESTRRTSTDRTQGSTASSPAETTEREEADTPTSPAPAGFEKRGKGRGKGKSQR